MLLAERVNRYITEYKSIAFCDDCIAEELGVSQRQQIHQITNALGTTDAFHRDKGRCYVCDREKKVTVRV